MRVLSKLLPVVVAGLVGLVGCVPTGVKTDFDPEFSFRGVRTFAWTEPSDKKRDELADASPFLERRLRRAVERTLEERGFRLATAGGEADLLISAFVVGPRRRDTPWRLWAANRCVGSPGIAISIGYPFGFSRRVPWYRYRDFYRWDPWGYACSYRLGFGYIWVPLYDQPGDRTPGTLVVDVLDPANKELVWRGWLEGALFDLDPDAPQAQVDVVVARVLERFPPGS